MAASKNIQSTTQKFLDIHDVTNNLVILKNGSVSFVLAVSAMNFGLLAEQEQDAIIYTYAALLNSLNYPIQIVIQSQTKDATKYLNLLKDQEQKSSSQEKAAMISRYRNFVAQLIKERNVLDKKFYVVAPANAMELGLVQANSFIPGQDQFDISKYEKSIILEKAQSVLEPRRDHLVSQFARIGLFARQLTTQEIIKIFYTNYNPEASEGLEIADTSEYTTPLVRANLIKQQNRQPTKKQPAQTNFSEYYQENDQKIPQNQPSQQQTQANNQNQQPQSNQNPAQQQQDEPEPPKIKQQPQSQPNSNMPSTNQVKTKPQQDSLTSPSSSGDLAIKQEAPTETNAHQSQPNQAHQNAEKTQENQNTTQKTELDISEDISSFKINNPDEDKLNTSEPKQATSQNQIDAVPHNQQKETQKSQQDQNKQLSSSSTIKPPAAETQQAAKNQQAGPANSQAQQPQLSQNKKTSAKIERIEPVDKNISPDKPSATQTAPQQKAGTSQNNNIPQPTPPNKNASISQDNQQSAPQEGATVNSDQKNQTRTTKQTTAKPSHDNNNDPQQVINDSLKKIDVYNQDDNNSNNNQSNDLKQIPEIK